MATIRKFAPLLIGFAAGAGAMGLYLASSDRSPEPGRGALAVGDAATGLASGDDAADRRQPVSVAERLTVYRAVQSESDTAALGGRLAALARQPASYGRDVEIDAALVRLSELAPEEAARTALSLGLDARFVADAFVAWGRAAPDAALAGLAEIGDAASRRDVALSLLEVFGDDARGFARITSVLPASDGDGLTVEWLSRRVEYDPYGAFREARTLRDPALERRVLTEIAGAWAELDPLGALSMADQLTDTLSRSFRGAVFETWARIDTAAFADYLESQTNPPQEVTAGLQYLVASDPDRGIRAAENLAGTAGDAFRLSAVSMLALSDPDAAIARLTDLPAGQERDRLIQAVASALGRSDPEKAIAWVEGLDPPSPDAKRNLVMAVAQRDFDAALDLLERPGFGVDSSLVLSMAASSAARDPTQAATMANRLLEGNNLQWKSALQSLLANWMRSDSESALTWVLGNSDAMDTATLVGAAQAMAQQDPAAAAAMVDRLPQKHVATWVVQVAGQYARDDPDAALLWLSRYQGQDFYARALRDAVTATSQTNPRSAATLLRQAGPEVQRGAAASVAANFARSEPRAAANWASELGDPQARNQAVASAVGAWAAADLQGARSWTLSLRSGETRDQALTNLVAQSASTGDFDTAALRYFDSDAKRQQALTNAVMVLARTNPDQARDLVEHEVTDANTRRMLEVQLQRGNNIPTPSSLIIN